MYIRERLSARLVEKKHRDNRERADVGGAVTRHGDAIREASSSRTRLSAASGGPRRADRLSALRHVGVGSHDCPWTIPAGAAPDVRRPSIGYGSGHPR
jgi:hypothetical protein